jgi:hypothetical protein
MSQATLAKLNRLVTSAILVAERTKPGSDAWRTAYARVADFEEQIADILPAGTLEGDIARRGSVGAAVMSGDRPRARGLFDHYLREGMSPELAAALEKTIDGPRDPAAPSARKVEEKPRFRRRAMLDAISAFRPGPPKDPRYVGARCPECGRSDGGHNSRCPKRLEIVAAPDAPQKT